MARFKVGDEVRVKAGSHTWRLNCGLPISVFPHHECVGVKLRVRGVTATGRVHYEFAGKPDPEWDICESDHLEPWNPAEEWDGSKWVAKRGISGLDCSSTGAAIGTPPKPAIVILREDGKLKPNSPPHVHESTSKATAEAERLSKLHPGQEFVVFQEVRSKRERKLESPIVAAMNQKKIAVLEFNGIKQDVYVTECPLLNHPKMELNGKLTPVSEPYKVKS